MPTCGRGPAIGGAAPFRNGRAAQKAVAADTFGRQLERGFLAIVVTGAIAHGANICRAFGPTPINQRREAVAAAHYSDAVTERIRAIALTALELAVVDDAVRDHDQLARLPGVGWVHASTVRAYFRARDASLR